MAPVTSRSDASCCDVASLRESSLPSSGPDTCTRVYQSCITPLTLLIHAMLKFPSAPAINPYVSPPFGQRCATPVTASIRGGSALCLPNVARKLYGMSPVLLG